MLVWSVFIAFVLFFLALDLGVFNKTPHIISSKEAGIWTGIWVTISFLFSGVIYWIYANGFIETPSNLTPPLASMKFITSYLIELSLSVDNIFVIAVIFSSFKIPQKHQHRVLFWGILGAIIFRGSMIYFGVLLINKFSWMVYFFGVFLIFTAAKMLFKSDEEEVFNLKKSLVFKGLRKVMPITLHMEGEHFFCKKEKYSICNSFICNSFICSTYYN